VSGSATLVSALISRPTGWLDRLSDRRFALVVSLPGAVLLLIVLLPPIAAVLGMSLFRIELARGDPTSFVGLRNYQFMTSDSNLLASIPLTLAFAAATALLSLPLALGSALLLTRRFVGASLLGVVLLLPWAIAPVVTGVYWGFMFQGQFGIATALLNELGIADGSVPWLQQSQTAIAVAVMATTWRSVPLLALILLAALKRIPESLYRAAKADGASAFDSFRYITLPSIRNSLLLAGVLQVIISLQVFDTIYTLTGGGPGRSTTVLIYYVFEAAFRQLSLGYSAALALLLTVLIAVCSLPLIYARLRSIGRRAPDDAKSGDVESYTGIDLNAPRLQQRREFARPQRPQTQRQGGGNEARVVPRAYLIAHAFQPYAQKAVFFFAAAALIIWSVGPILWIAVASTQHEGAITSVPVALSTPHLENYTDLFIDARRGTFGPALPWINGIWTSIQIAILAAAGTVLVGALMAYPLARLEVPYKGSIMALLIATQMIPAIVFAIPVLFIFRAIALDDTIAGLAIVSAAFHLPIIVWLLRNVFEDVPVSLERAARMCGCSRLGTVFRVTIPAAAPGIFAAVILVLIGTWNEFLFAVVLGNTEAITVMRLIGTVEISSGPTGRAPYTLLAAAGILAVLPVIMLVAVFHRRIVAGLTEVHVKG